LRGDISERHLAEKREEEKQEVNRAAILKYRNARGRGWEKEQIKQRKESKGGNLT